MKILVAYYSLEGNSELVARAIAEATDADILEIKPKNDISPKGFLRYFKGGFQVLTKKEPELVPFDREPAEYDLIFLGTPVWAGNFTPAIRSFLAQVQLENKKIALFCCYGGNEGKCLKRLKEKLSGNEIIGEMGFIEPLKKEKQANVKKAEEWAKEIITKTQS